VPPSQPVTHNRSWVAGEEEACRKEGRAPPRQEQSLTILSELPGMRVSHPQKAVAALSTSSHLRSSERGGSGREVRGPLRWDCLP
jgi:hypothetical protein